ncbi:hypothetical protein CXIVA_18790 [Clostridium sp. SY8519]|jgi:hypothetical protein|nr:hypothetical protein CXIVA_18790 [Clostridium sp. SY8519]
MIEKRVGFCYSIVVIVYKFSKVNACLNDGIMQILLNSTKGGSMKRRKQKRMEAFVLSVLLASSLSAPSIAMAAEAQRRP